MTQHTAVDISLVCRLVDEILRLRVAPTTSLRRLRHAAETCDDQPINNKRARPNDTSTNQTLGQVTNDSRYIFVARLSPLTAEPALMKLFSQFGQVERVHVAGSKHRVVSDLSD
jgi:hypothetical protein